MERANRKHLEIRRTYFLSRSTWTNQISSVPTEPIGKHTKHLTAAGGDTRRQTIPKTRLHDNSLPLLASPPTQQWERPMFFSLFITKLRFRFETSSLIDQWLRVMGCQKWQVTQLTHLTRQWALSAIRWTQESAVHKPLSLYVQHSKNYTWLSMNRYKISRLYCIDWRDKSAPSDLTSGLVLTSWTC